MEKTVLRLNIRDRRFHLSQRTLTLLLVTLLIMLSTQLTSHADTGQLLFRGDDFRDPGSLAVKLQDRRAALSEAIVPQLSAETQRLLDRYDGISNLSTVLQNALLTDLNRLLQAGPLYDAQSFTKIRLSEQTEALLAQDPKSGEVLMRLNRLLLSDVYPHELASPAEKQIPENAETIKKCRENLRRIQQAREKYRDPQWLSELSPEYLDKKALLCPADATSGKPGVLTENAEDPILPCSYLYEFRPSEKSTQEIILANEGDMLPIVRCEHHLLNLSVGGKLYRNGPQREIYRGKKRKIAVARLDGSGDVYAQLKAQLGEDFLKSPEGQDVLKQIHTSPPSTSVSIRQTPLNLIGKPMPNFALTDLSGKSVELETFQSEFMLLSIFSIKDDNYGPKLQRLEELLKDYDSSELQIVGLSTDDSAKAIEAFKEKYGLSMPIWIGKNMRMGIPVDSGAKLVTLLLNRDLVVKDMPIDSDPEVLAQKVKQAIASKN